MILYADSDAAYLILEGAKSRIAGYFYCSNKSVHVVTSATEAETAGLFLNGQKIIEVKRMLNVETLALCLVRSGLAGRAVMRVCRRSAWGERATSRDASLSPVSLGRTSERAVCRKIVAST